MASSRVKSSKGSVQFWLPDPADFDHLMELLEIYGYTDECLAREEAGECGESNAVIEVTVRRRELVMPQPWREEVNHADELPDRIIMHA